jgi:hypothetical protein
MSLYAAIGIIQGNTFTFIPLSLRGASSSPRACRISVTQYTTRQGHNGTSNLMGFEPVEDKVFVQSEPASVPVL